MFDLASVLVTRLTVINRSFSALQHSDFRLGGGRTCMKNILLIDYVSQVPVLNEHHKSNVDG